MILYLDHEKIEIEHHLVNYDVFKVSQKIREVGLLNFLVERLHLGI